MYRIKQAAARAGVSVELLRAWERRYGVVHPDRTASGYRVYDDESIERLRAMRHLVDEGWSPSAASDSIRTSDPARVHELAQAPGPASRTPGGEPAGVVTVADVGGTSSGALIEAFVAAGAALDADRVEAVLDEMFARGSFESVMDELLFPALQRLGEAWADGRLDVAAEHAATHAVLRRLAAAFQAAGRPGREPPILVGLPPGSRHEVGALAFAIAARRSGLPVLYLGADLPAVDWVEAMAASHASAVVVGIVTRADRPAADEVVAALIAARPELVIAIGGAGVEPAGPAGPGDIATRLPAGLVAAVDIIRSKLGRRP